MSRSSRCARLSIVSNTALILMKFVVGFFTGSVSIVSEAIHSLMDLVAAVIAFVSIKIADQPPDPSHPYGHEKIENISGVIETVLIFAASFLIIVKAVKKLIHHAPVEMVGMGCAVMAVSAVVNILVSRKLYAVAREEGSVALEADALHLKVDVFTSLGVSLGLLIVWITGLHVLDPVIAILIALFIMKEAYDMLVSTFGPLMDAKLSDAEIEDIKGIIDNYDSVFVDYHELRTRKAGRIKHIDLHLTAPYKMTVHEFHSVCDAIERAIEYHFKNTKVLIHGEPCDACCSSCRFSGNRKYCA